MSIYLSIVISLFSLVLSVLLYFVVWPILVHKLRYYFMERDVRKMAKRHTGELKDELIKIAESMRDLRKQGPNKGDE